MMLKIKEMYRRPPARGLYPTCFLIGVCLAATSSVFLIGVGKASYAPFLAPLVIGFALVWGRHALKNRMQIECLKVATLCATANLMMLAVFILLFW